MPKLVFVVAGVMQHSCKKMYVKCSMFRDDGEDTREEKDLVRGYTFAEYHADVYDRTEEEVMLDNLHFFEFTFQGHQSWTGL